MMKKISALIIGIFLAYGAQGQTQDSTFQKWYWQPNYGFNIPLSSFEQGGFTDYLMALSDQSQYWQLIQASYFWSPHWGIEAGVQANDSRAIFDRYQDFQDESQNEFGDQYFVDPIAGSEFTAFNFLTGNFQHGYLGIVYRKETIKWIWLPSFRMGLSSYQADWGQQLLKEIDANKVRTIRYQPDEINQDRFYVGLAFTAGYRIMKNLHLSLNSQFNYFQTNTLFEISDRDHITDETTRRFRRYNNNIYSLSLGIGLVVAL